MAVVCCMEVRQHDMKQYYVAWDLVALRVGVHVWEWEPLQEGAMTQCSTRRYNSTNCCRQEWALSIVCCLRPASCCMSMCFDTNRVLFQGPHSHNSHFVKCVVSVLHHVPCQFALAVVCRKGTRCLGIEPIASWTGKVAEYPSLW